MPDINEIKKIVVPIAYSYGVKRLYLFGSYAKGTASEKSDLVTTAGILCTQYYGLKNNIWALFIPYGMSVWHMFILRGSFREIPEELIESARLDGASHGKIFMRIAIPLARAGLLTVSLFNIFGLWNDFFLPQWLITDSAYQTLQKILYSMLSNAQQLLHNSEMSAYFDHITLPAETAKMAVTVLGGCGKQENTKPASDSGDESASSADMEEGEDEQANKPQEEADKGSTEPVSLRIVVYGDAGSRNVEFFKNEFHDKVLADTNIDMKVDLVPWGGGSDMRSCHCHH